MAKLFKISAYVVDGNGEFGTEDRLEDCLTYCTQNDLSLNHLKINSADIGEWDDNHPLNYVNCDIKTYDKYFVDGLNGFGVGKSRDMAIYILTFIRDKYAEIHKDAGVVKYLEALQMGIDALVKLPELEEKAWMYDELNK